MLRDHTGRPQTSGQAETLECSEVLGALPKIEASTAGPDAAALMAFLGAFREGAVNTAVQAEKLEANANVVSFSGKKSAA